MELNGGSVVAMVGKDCVAIASDLRLGNQAVGIAANFDKVSETFRAGLPDGAPPQTSSTADCLKVFPVNDKLYYALPGLATDVYTLSVHRFPCRVARS